VENKQIATYLGQKDYKTLHNRATSQGFTVASYVRYLILKSFKEKL
jgi:hypothetical protein